MGGGIWRTEDRGASFRQISDDRNMLARPWYYTHVDAHPTNPDIIFGSCKGWVDRATDQQREFWIWPQEGHTLANREFTYREQWVSQLRFSPATPASSTTRPNSCT